MSFKDRIFIIEFNQYQKSDKTPFNIYADLECIIEKIDRCKNIPGNSYADKILLTKESANLDACFFTKKL